MKKKINDVEEYFSIGCGRCEKGNTPDCKVHQWSEELAQLRRIALESDLTETLKWSQPCYTYNEANVVMISAFKKHSFMSFMRGSILKDSKKILHAAGANSNYPKVARFEDVRGVLAKEKTLKAYIGEAIELVKAGIKVEVQATEQAVPIELQVMLDEDPGLKDAFESLTPGRKRSYYLHISAAKQAKTRESRVEKCIPKIIDGLGFNEYPK